MSSSRLFEIVYLLLERRQMTAAELAERFEVSVRTIYRDIDALSSAGIPVCTTQGKGGGVSLMEHFVLDRAAFTQDEQRRLLTALQSLPGTGSADVLAKLSGLFRLQETDWLQVDLSHWGCGEADNQKFECLRDAILKKQIVSFTYVSTYGRTTDRRIFPARLVFKGQAWYLQGFCTEKEDYRTFKLTRILHLEVLQEHFDRTLSPPAIDNSGASSLFGVPVRLRFSPFLAYRVYDEFDEGCIHHTPSGALEVSVTFPEDRWLYGYLLSFGVGVEVLSPKNVRQKLALLAKEIWHSNNEPDAGCQVTWCKMDTSKHKEVLFMEHTKQPFCQSCGMPLCEAEVHGTEKDGSPSEHYCKHCYQKGDFTSSMSMEEMIDFCVPYMVEGNPGITAEQAKEQMYKFFPMLLRWKQDSL